MNNIEIRGLTFGVTLHHDDQQEFPWEREDGHGPVRYMSRSPHAAPSSHPSKSPGERVLHSDRRGAWLYNWQEAVSIAKRDTWGIDPKLEANIARNYGRPLSVAEVRAAAVQQDFDRMRKFLAGDWSYVGVSVTLLDVDGKPTHRTDSLWGMESDCEEYIATTAREMAEQIAGTLGRKKYIEQRTRIRA